tara:strand:+ start:354 stop:830 length:477 start_codon:yes stop_codon:yes gene_type:complete
LSLDSEFLEKTIFSNSLDDTKKLGIKLGKNIQKEDIILLAGDLGAGKTELVRSIVEGSGSESFVRSPTFVLINNYEGPTKITHCDFYRMDENLDEEELGIEEYYEDSATLIEWPERVKNNLPDDCLIIKIFFTEIDNQREFKFYSTGNKSKALLEGIQ